MPSASFDPTGQRVVTASLDETARVWNTIPGFIQQTARLARHLPVRRPERLRLLRERCRQLSVNKVLVTAIAVFVFAFFLNIIIKK